MGILENRKRKKEVKNYIDTAESNLTHHLRRAKENLLGIKYCMDEMNKYSHLEKDNNDRIYMEESYTKRIVEKSPIFCTQINAADKLFEDLSKYIEENIDFVSNKHKNDTKKIEEIFKIYRREFSDIYMKSADLKIASKHHAAIVEAFNKVIEGLPHEIIINNTDGISEGV